MDVFDRRRAALQRAIREPDWRPEVASDEGQALKELEDMGWVVLNVEGFCYRQVVTERGLERHSGWGDERRGSRRRDAE